MNDLVSIIMPSFNSANYIKESILSIQNQTYTNWELLITDDCSEDNTVEIIKSCMVEDTRIKIFNLLQNSGSAVARNNSIKESKGRFIAFCDSDDQWKPEKLKKQIEFMHLENCVFSYSSYDCINEKGDFLKVINCPLYLTYSDLLKNCYIGCLTVIYDANVIGKNYMPLIRKRQDWAYWLQLIKQCHEAKGLKESLAIYRKRPGSISSNKFEMIKYNWLIYYQVERFSLIKSLFYFFIFLFFYFKKKIFN